MRGGAGLAASGAKGAVEGLAGLGFGKSDSESGCQQLGARMVLVKLAAGHHLGYRERGSVESVVAGTEDRGPQLG